LANGAKEVVYFRQLFEELHHMDSDPTIFFCDNQFAIKLLKNTIMQA
jgi:hypothetical protein